ncbi:MAG: polysaccharide biosynthesis/export family protein [Pseudomonadota bacterium]
MEMRLTSRVVRLLTSIALVAAVSACALPRSGPDFDEITEDPQLADYGFQILPISPDVTTITKVDETTSFEVSYIEAKPEPVHTVAAGDVLSITVWENIDEGLLNPAGIGATPLPNSVVDEQGRVFVPYVGLINASGRSINQLREAIRNSLADKTLNPQVDIFPVDKKGRQISIQGTVGAPGVYPIESPTKHILAMLARAGGVTLEPDIAKVKLRRGRLQGEIWLRDLFDDPINDVHLKNGDAIIAERDRRIFTALGEVSGPSTVQFPKRDLSILTALGTVGGLNGRTADPTGVFLFREEPVEIAQRLFPGQDITEPQRVAYILDMTQPAGIFLARDFFMRDGDTLYVTTAPFVRFLQILQAISPIINFGGSARNLGGF